MIEPDQKAQSILNAINYITLATVTDVNAPTVPGVKTQDSQWFKDIMKMFDRLDTPTADKPQSHTGLIVTNYSFHYDGNNVTMGSGFGFVWGQYPKYPIAGGINGTFMTRLRQATGGYGYVPPNLASMGGPAV